ncbi:hypothetical protein [Pandoraea apista]|uniref:Acyl carrier protein n=1 Tax=Pandoraea apista TaxID=93218 RepID=A0A5E5NY10_9BURK|nr:hypothetical protein [Pandoraea apista]OXS94789.1 hypothetical protein B7H01_09815 [Pandoraea apista]VVG69107.1 hypothetical protein PAP18089_00058 [Pandoraea apista]
MSPVSQILSDSLATILENVSTETPIEFNSDTNILDFVDSFAIVDLLLETEGRLETEFGRYVPLADDTIFDAEKSPLRKWSTWISYVESRLAE